MHDWRRWVGRVGAALLLGLLAWYVSRPAGSAYTRIDGEAFATHYRITYADGPDADTLQRAVDAELARIDAMASTWRDDAELMRYNRAENPDRFDLSPELAGLIERAKAIEAQSGGAFSPRPDGGTIDLSAIAKGYAVDRVTALLQDRFGITDGLVDIGGEIKAFGDGPQGDGWRLGIYAARNEAGAGPPTLRLKDTSIATSGTYFKGPHIIEPATGKPVINALRSVSVIHPSNTTADALATALFVMGPERGMAWAKANAVRAVLILKDGTQRESIPDDFDNAEEINPDYIDDSGDYSFSY